MKKLRTPGPSVPNEDERMKILDAKVKYMHRFYHIRRIYNNMVILRVQHFGG